MVYKGLFKRKFKYGVLLISYISYIGDVYAIGCVNRYVSTHFKMTRTLTILSFLSLASCGQVENKPADSTISSDNSEIKLIPFELTVEEADYSMSHTLIYVLTEKDLKIISRSDFNIVGMQKGENMDTVIEMELKPNAVLQKLSNINLDSLEDGYFNHCIMDGSQITVQQTKGNKSKRIHLSNFYQADIGLLVELINSLTPKEYKIWYDKKELIERLRLCK
ncbi:MAG: hypothetical protein EAZ07_08725 [Cytophagales bacterium]|nr:MAG: hypothetical protein EAZ07_08725 [Cytophagales bacterium]